MCSDICSCSGGSPGFLHKLAARCVSIVRSCWLQHIFVWLVTSTASHMKYERNPPRRTWVSLEINFFGQIISNNIYISAFSQLTSGSYADLRLLLGIYCILSTGIANKTDAFVIFYLIIRTLNVTFYNRDSSKWHFLAALPVCPDYGFLRARIPSGNDLLMRQNDLKL